MVAEHPVLEGRRQSRVDPVHRQGFIAKASLASSETIVVGRPGDRVARRSLDFYQAVADHLAATGGRA
jgi:hypothetical protein